MRKIWACFLNQSQHCMQSSPFQVDSGINVISLLNVLCMLVQFFCMRACTLCGLGVCTSFDNASSEVNCTLVSLLTWNCRECMYRIRSNKCPGRLTKSFRVGTNLFHIFCKDQPPPHHKDTSRPSWLMDMGVWLIVLWLIIAKFDRWALIEAWAAMGMNTVLLVKPSMTLRLK